MDRREFLKILGWAPAVPTALALPLPGLVPTKPIDRHDWRPFPASASNVGFISPKLFETYANELFTEVCSRLSVARRITMEYEAEVPAMRQGSTVNIPLVQECVVPDLLESDFASPRIAWTLENIPITLEHHIEGTHRIAIRDLTDREKRKANMFSIALNLAERIEQDLLDLRCEFYSNRPIRVKEWGRSDGMIDAVHERLFKARVPVSEQKYLVVDHHHYEALRRKERVIDRRGRLFYKNIEIFPAPMSYRKLQLAFTRGSMVCVVRKLGMPEPWALYPNRGPHDMMYAAHPESRKLGFGMRVLGIQSPMPGWNPRGEFLQIHAEVLYGVGVLREHEGVQVIV